MLTLKLVYFIFLIPIEPFFHWVLEVTACNGLVCCKLNDVVLFCVSRHNINLNSIALYTYSKW